MDMDKQQLFRMLIHHTGEDWGRCEYRCLKTSPELGNRGSGAGKGVKYGGLVPTAPAELHWREIKHGSR